MELREIDKQLREAMGKFSVMYEKRLIEICAECGILGVDVVADSGKKGRICIEKKPFSNYYDVNFHHYTKNGGLSKNSSYTGFFISNADSDDDIKKNLIKTFKPAN